MKRPVTVAELVRKAGRARMASMTPEQRKDFAMMGVQARTKQRRSFDENNEFDMTPASPGTILNEITMQPGEDLFRRIEWCNQLMNPDRARTIVVPRRFPNKKIERTERTRRHKLDGAKHERDF